jgi:hypothetical protein
MIDKEKQSKKWRNLIMETTNVVTVSPKCGQIVCDFEGAKAYLQSRLDEYKGVIFTEDTKKDAKQTVADLRKEKKAFEDRVKEVRNEYMTPFNAFAEQAMELIAMYDEPINFINAQVADFERKRIEEKRVLINQLYEEFIGCDEEIAEYLPLQRIYNTKWENATVNRSAIAREIVDYKENAKQAITAIKAMHSDVEDVALKMYKESLDTTRCILYINQHEQQKAEILAREQERIRREEEERIRREERTRIEAEMRAEEEKRVAVEQAKEEAVQDVVESLTPTFVGESSLYEYRISLTKDAKEKLETYMDSVGIEWEMM